MAIIENLTLNLVTQTVKYEKGLRRAAKATDSFEKRMAKTLKVTAAFGAGMATAASAGVALMVRQQIKMIDATAKVSDRLGIATEKLTGIRHAANLAGIEQNKLDLSMQRSTRRIAEAAAGTGEAAGAIRELGLDARRLNTLSPDKQFEAIAASMSKVENQGDRVRLAMRLFDTEGVALIQLLQQGVGALQEGQVEAEKFGLTLSRFEAAKVERAKDALTRVDAVFDGIARRLTVELAPIIQILAEEFVEWATKGEGATGKVTDAIDFAIDNVAVFIDWLNAVGLVLTSVGSVGAAAFTVTAKAANLATGGMIEGLDKLEQFAEASFDQMTSGAEFFFDNIDKSGRRVEARWRQLRNQGEETGDALRRAAFVPPPRISRLDPEPVTRPLVFIENTLKDVEQQARITDKALRGITDQPTPEFEDPVAKKEKSSILDSVALFDDYGAATDTLAEKFLKFSAIQFSRDPFALQQVFKELEAGNTGNVDGAIERLEKLEETKERLRKRPIGTLLDLAVGDKVREIGAGLEMLEEKANDAVEELTGLENVDTSKLLPDELQSVPEGLDFIVNGSLVERQTAELFRKVNDDAVLTFRMEEVKAPKLQIGADVQDQIEIATDELQAFLELAGGNLEELGGSTSALELFTKMADTVKLLAGENATAAEEAQAAAKVITSVVEEAVDSLGGLDAKSRELAISGVWDAITGRIQEWDKWLDEIEQAPPKIADGFGVLRDAAADVSEELEGPPEPFPAPNLEQLLQGLRDQNELIGKTAEEQERILALRALESAAAKDRVEETESYIQALDALLERKRQLTEDAGGTSNDPVQQFLESLRQENELIGKTAEQQDRILLQRELMEAAQQRGIDTTNAESEEFSRLVDEMFRLAEESDKVQERKQLVREGAQDVADTLLNVALRAEDASEAFENLAESLAVAIAKLLLYKAIETGLNFLFPGLGTATETVRKGTGFDPFDDILDFTGDGSPLEFAKGGIINSPHIVAPGAIAGERGPEAILPLTRDRLGNLGVQQVQIGDLNMHFPAGTRQKDVFRTTGEMLREETRRELGRTFDGVS